jgi:TRAP-type C4-dicarboxylate transport system substrate-binding protein
MNVIVRLLVFLFILVFSPSRLFTTEPAEQSSVVIKMATLAPSGSPWHENLKEIAAEWNRVSGGTVTLRIYPDGVAGDEADMIRKIRIGQLHGAMITNAGLSRIVTEANALTIPLAVDSWESLDRVRNVLKPKLEKLLEAQGIVVLNWGDGGWVRFFVSNPDVSVKTVQKAKLFVWSSDDGTADLWKASGFNAIPLSSTDILPGLQTGMINAYNTTATVALASQWFPFTPYMIDMPWAPLIGVTVVNKNTWDKIPPSMRPELKRIAEDAMQRLQKEVRKMDEQAVSEMQKRGLKVIKLRDDQYKEWQNVAKASYSKIRGTLIPDQWFDDAMQAAKGGK